MSLDNILDTIVEKRKADILKSGYAAGENIPDKRRRSVTPFMDRKGSILEIKRASPSKGDIALDLDAKETALKYAASGAAAISVLTEHHYFKGCLKDLIDVCEVIGRYSIEHPEYEKLAILRKDFLFSVEDVETSYLCGADAVLLISRMLDKDIMTAMALKCQELKMTAFVELRQKEDLDKLEHIICHVDRKYIVCGVNSRDLRDFSIDLLTPCCMKDKIRCIMGEDARVIFESGIKSDRSAYLAGSFGFSGMLLGEGAARNPDSSAGFVSAFADGKENSNSIFWKWYAVKLAEKKRKTPYIKICGITNTEDALKAAFLGADYLGFVFYDKSQRNVLPDTVRTVKNELKKLNLDKIVKTVAVVADPYSDESRCAFRLVEDKVIDLIQFHSCSDYIMSDDFKSDLPHYSAVNIKSESDLSLVDSLIDMGECRILLDAGSHEVIGGSGCSIEKSFVLKAQKKIKLWLAGGINCDNIRDIIVNYRPELLDVSSGLEEYPGKKDFNKMKRFFDIINKLEEV